MFIALSNHILSPKSLLIALLLGSIGTTISPTASAKPVVIDTYPVKEGRVYVNGEFAGIAPVEVDVRFGLFFLPSRTKIATADGEGTVARWKTRFDRSSRDVQVRLEEDEHYRSTVASDVANKWLKVSPQAGDDDTVLWQKIVSVVTDNFSDLESLNTGSLYLRTAWRVRNFSHSAARTRLVVKRDVSDKTGFKVMLETEFAEKRSGSNEVKPNDYQPTTRVFQADKETIDFLRDQL